ncbi:MAG: sialate O-acetylesterase [Paraglaciecola sp.]|nr:sialate O-acetylesterase [Paraglaciecola sp.]
MLRPLIVLCIIVSQCAVADVSVPKLISDHMVLQRDITIPIWGYADDGESVLVKLNGKPIGHSIGNKGKWQISLPAQAASGPHQLDIIANNRITIKDVYFGDVWLASGQSNMELPMRRVAEDYPADIADADYPLIRQFKIPQIYNFKTPQEDFASGSWSPVTQDNISDVSAVALYFAKALYKHNGVAIGILNNALGGSPVEAWMSEEALQKFPESLAEGIRFRDDELIATITAADKAKDGRWYTELNKKDQGLVASTPWYSPELDDSEWDKFTIPGKRLLTEGENFNGVWWFRKTITLTAEQVANANTLRLGRIVDADEAYINGIKVGNTTYQYPPRRYSIPNDLLKEGQNTLAVRVIANSGRSEFVADKPYWLGTDQQHIDIAGDWKVKTAAVMPPLAGGTFIRWKPMGLYNGLTAPLTHLPIKGVIWFQGESNVGQWHDYHTKFSTMIQDWRTKWGQGDFPFIFAQLANFMEKQAKPIDSAWAQLRQAQSQTLSEPNTAMAVTIDIGEWNDIHPTNKKTVGKRLALAARALALGEDVVYQGPEVASIQVQNNDLLLGFKHIADGLVLKSTDDHSFAIAGADGHFEWANAALINDKIRLSSPNIKQPVRVRYAWGDNPDAALYNSEQLPAVPFDEKVSTNPL